MRHSDNGGGGRRLAALALAALVPASRAVLAYGHAFNAPGDFTAAQYEYIAATFPLFTVEKRHAYAVYGNASAPAASPARYNSIAASVRLTRTTLRPPAAPATATLTTLKPNP